MAHVTAKPFARKTNRIQFEQQFYDITFWSNGRVTAIPIGPPFLPSRTPVFTDPPASKSLRDHLIVLTGRGMISAISPGEAYGNPA